MPEVAVVCHRGANHVAPENTLAAAKKCIEWGVAYVEVDVRTSKDGVMYILHDPTVDRTTNGKGRLRDLTSSEIDILDAGGWFAPEFSGEPLPRLEMFLRWIAGKAGVFFDVKDADIAELISLVREIGMENDCFFWFGEDAMARTFRHLAPDLSLKINAVTPEDVIAAVEEYHPTIIEVGLGSLTPDMIAVCREQNLKLMVLEMTNSESAFRHVIEGKADMINLDYPDVFLGVQKAMTKQ